MIKLTIDLLNSKIRGQEDCVENGCGDDECKGGKEYHMGVRDGLLDAKKLLEQMVSKGLLQD